MKTIIFDLDGTLVESHLDIVASINHVRQMKYGLHPMETSCIIEKMNRPGLNLAYEFYGVEEYEEDAREMFEEHYSRQCLVNAKTYPGIVEMLEGLKEKACELYVATNAPTETSKLILHNNNIDSYFADIIGADRVARAKPDPEMITHIKNRTKFDEVWMIGDSLKDIMAAESGGVRPLFVQWGYSPGLPENFSHISTVFHPKEVKNIIFNNILLTSV